MTNPWQFFKSSPCEQASLSQEAWLLDCLSRNKNSTYGQYYQFAQIKNRSDYQKSLPIVDYEALIPWLKRLTYEENILFAEPVIAFEQTGGSHSGGKLIPYSKTGLDDFRRPLLAWLVELIDYYQLDEGCAYWALSPAMAQQQSEINGVAVGGGDALYLGEENLTIFMQLSAVPFSVAKIQNLQEWQLLTLYYLIKRDDLRLISVWSPSFLLLLLEAIPQHQQLLSVLFNEGGVIADHQLNADKAAAKRLEAYLNSAQTQDLWPQLKVLSCWADASSASLAKALQKHFPHANLQGKGLLSTEAIITTPDVQGQKLLCTTSNFYEFLDPQGHLYFSDELTLQRTYQVIVTTNSGLYRYNTGDQVLCLGYQQEQPILQFMGRAGVVSDVVGEKLTESFVNQCLDDLQDYAMLVYDCIHGGYVLLLECNVNNLAEVTAQVEQRLCRNPQYAYARKLQQLTPLTFQAIRVLRERYVHWCLKQNKRLGDIKLPTLLLQDWRQVFTE